MSAEHGIGVGDLLDEVVKQLPAFEDNSDPEVNNFALIGMPNVGKSSLTNEILGEESVIVSEIEGTTRDAIDTEFKRDGKKYSKIHYMSVSNGDRAKIRSKTFPGIANAMANQWSNYCEAINAKLS